jgi:hypothetical protein
VHAGGGEVNRGRHTTNFGPKVQVLDMSTLGDAADVAWGARMCPTMPRDLPQLRQSMWRQSLLSTARCCNVWGRNWITGLTSDASPRVDISSTCNLGQKFVVCLPLLTCSPSAWTSRLLYRRGRKFRRDLRVTLYMCCTPKATVWCELTVLNLAVMFLSFFAGKATRYSHSLRLLDGHDKNLLRDRNPTFWRRHKTEFE